MKIEVNISKKYAFGIIGALLLLAGLFVVYAYGGNQPNIVGHTGGEIAPGKLGGSLANQNSNWEIPGTLNVTTRLLTDELCIEDGLSFECVGEMFKRGYFEHGNSYYNDMSVSLLGAVGTINETEIGSASRSFCALQHIQVWGDDSAAAGCQIYSPDSDWQTGKIYLKAYRANVNQKVYCVANCLSPLQPSVG